MTIVKESTGDAIKCEGCGRLDAGPGAPLHMQEFIVRDPNLGSDVMHHYCGGCAVNRGYSGAARLEFGWTAAPVPPSEPNETHEQRKDRTAAHGPFIPGTGEGSIDR